MIDGSSIFSDSSSLGDPVTIGRLVDYPLEQGSLISIESVWNHSVATSQVHKISLADEKYEKFYLPASFSKVNKLQEKLDRDLKRAELAANAGAGASFVSRPRLDISLLAPSRPPKGRLEIRVEEKLLAPCRRDPIKLLELLDRSREAINEMTLTKANSIDEQQKSSRIAKPPMSSIASRKASIALVKERAARVREKRQELQAEEEREAYELLQAKLNRADDMTRKTAVKLLLAAVKSVNVFSYLHGVIKEDRERKEEENIIRRQREKEWYAALRIQRRFILKWVDRCGSNVTHRADSVRRLTQSLMSQKASTAPWKAQGVALLEKRSTAANLIVTFTRMTMTTPFILAKKYILKIKTVQRYWVAYQKHTDDRCNLLSLVVDAFYSQLMTHLGILTANKTNFLDPVFNASIMQQIQSHPKRIDLRLYKKMLLPGFNEYLYSNLSRIQNIMKKELIMKGIPLTVDPNIRSHIINELLAQKRHEHMEYAHKRYTRPLVIDVECVTIDDVRKFMQDGQNPLQDHLKVYEAKLAAAKVQQKKNKYFVMNLLSLLEPVEMTEVLLSCVEGTELKKKSAKKDVLKFTSQQRKVSAATLYKTYLSFSPSTHISNDASIFTGTEEETEQETKEREKYAKRFGVQMMLNMGKSRLGKSGLGLAAVSQGLSSSRCSLSSRRMTGMRNGRGSQLGLSKNRLSGNGGVSMRSSRAPSTHELGRRSSRNGLSPEAKEIGGRSRAVR